MKATEIAQESRRCLALEPFLVKSRAEFNVHAGLRDFGAKFRIKKSRVQFAHGFGLLEPRPHWVEIGGCCYTLSRLKGMETGIVRLPV